MTVSELAQNLLVTPDVLISFFNDIQQPVSDDPGFEVPGELVLLAREHWESFNLSEKAKIDKAKKDLDKVEFNKLLAKSTFDLLAQIKKVNNLDFLVLSGHLKMSIGQGAGNFGFFEEILDTNGKYLYYPNYKGTNKLSRINKVFVMDAHKLEDGARYFFEVELSRTEERIKQDNPFLIQTSLKKVQNSNKLNEIIKAIKDKEATLKVLNKEITESQVLVGKNEESAILKLAHYDKIIENKNLELSLKENELGSITKALEITNNNLSKMENLINTLKERITLCKNLQFLKEEDEAKFLNLLTAKEFLPVDHLDFEQDFNKDFSKVADHIHAYLYHNKNLIYTRFQIRNFLALLQTHDLIVLSGLSGSGKTQIIKAFAEALGGVFKIIPVKPNWTSSDDLIGYYNPLQMSFLPTPFTEAIVEAIHNPSQLYFICLDEMNLARVEYYFADFLSKLEERTNLPEISLYANHEEELFLSEFSTLLNLVESSIKDQKVESWQDFLDNENARTKFFDMLGNSEKESMLQLHSKMKRRLIDLLKFPSTIKIPGNVRFIGAINVDETTHYFSPKILDRIHVIKFENPLLHEEEVNNWFKEMPLEKEMKPVYIHPEKFSVRTAYPKLNEENSENILIKLKEINSRFLIPLGIDFGIRSMRQSINFSLILPSSFPSITDDVEMHNMPDEGQFMEELLYYQAISLSTIVIQKILPRFNFDGSEMAKNNKPKYEVVQEFQQYLSDEYLQKFANKEQLLGKCSSEWLSEMIEQSKGNHFQFNFFA